MRILLVTGAAAPGGLHQHLLTLARGLLREGLRVQVALPQDARADPLAEACVRAGAGVARVGVAGKRDLRGALALRGLVARTRPDVVHVHLSSPVEGFPALLALRAGGAARIVTTEHAPTWHPLRRPWSRAVKRLLARRVAAVIAVSRSDARFLEEEFGLPAARLHVVENGVELDGYPGLRARGGEFRIGYLGALEPKKGIEDLLHAASLLSVADVEVALAGEGSLAAALAGRPRCRLHGRVADPRSFLAGLDVFAFPSHQEAMPLALLEAMAAGLPVVATRVGGIPEAVEDGISGLLVPPHRPDLLGAALARIAADPAGARRLG
jgi:glycosyltransferase involved in cell wall biosynthesis